MGSSFVVLNATKPGCMLKECNLGNVVTDAMVFHYAHLSASEEQWTDASIALQNSVSITASITVSAQGTATSVLMNTSYTLRFNRHFLQTRWLGLRTRRMLRGLKRKGGLQAVYSMWSVTKESKVAQYTRARF